MQKKTVFLAIILILFCSIRVNAATMETESNDNIWNASQISIGQQYTGTVFDTNADDEDYYAIPVKEGNFYKIDVYNMLDLDGENWNTMIASLCTENNTNDDYTISNGDYRSISKLFRAAYTGNYYLKFCNATNTSYSFCVNSYNPKGKTVKDSSSNSYKITGNYTLEFSKIASKRTKSFYFIGDSYFSNIGGIELLNSYNTPFTVTSIGNYAFKGSKIRSISIPKEIKKIGTGSFQNCKSLGSEKYFMGVVIYGKKVTIGSKAFAGCSKLGSIRILKSASIKSVKKNAFKNTKKGIRLEVPNIKKYKKIFKNAGFKKPKYSKGYI